MTAPFRRIPFLLLALFGGIAAHAEAIPAPMRSEGQELEQVLQELREVETQIERYLIEETGRGGARASRQASPPPAPTASAPSPAAALRDELGLGVSDEIQALARAKVESRMRLDEAEQGVRLAAILVLHEIGAERPDDARLLTLALIQGRHRAGANMAIEELLRLEQVRFARATAPEPVKSAKPARVDPNTTPLDELRDRHRELSTRLNELSTRVAQSRSQTPRFGEQRAQLNALMGRLSGGGTSGAGQARTGAALSGVEAQSGPSAPVVEKEGRRTFWRAKRARIHALVTGKVLFAGPFAGYRHLLILDHDNGWTSLYGNMTECFVKKDDVMSKGSVLGEYQAEAIGDPEPFWVEVRHWAEPADIESMPGIEPGWDEDIFRDETI